MNNDNNDNKTYLDGKYKKVGEPISYDEMKSLMDNDLTPIPLDKQLSTATKLGVDEFAVAHLVEDGDDATMVVKIAIKEDGEFKFYDKEPTDEHKAYMEKHSKLSKKVLEENGGSMEAVELNEKVNELIGE